MSIPIDGNAIINIPRKHQLNSNIAIISILSSVTSNIDINAEGIKNITDKMGKEDMSIINIIISIFTTLIESK